MNLHEQVKARKEQEKAAFEKLFQDVMQEVADKSVSYFENNPDVKQLCKKFCEMGWEAGLIYMVQNPLPTVE